MDHEAEVAALSSAEGTVAGAAVCAVIPATWPEPGEVAQFWLWEAKALQDSQDLGPVVARPRFEVDRQKLGVATGAVPG